MISKCKYLGRNTMSCLNNTSEFDNTTYNRSQLLVLIGKTNDNKLRLFKTRRNPVYSMPCNNWISTFQIIC